MNLLATSRPSDILSERRILLAPRVLAESLFLYADESRSARVQIDEHLLFKMHVEFSKVTLTSAEQSLSVRYALPVDDGEAETLAVAFHRSIPILTDDLGAIKLATSESIPVITTLDLIKDWVGKEASIEDVRPTLKRMQVAANYAIPRTHHLRTWFLSVLTAGER